MDQPKTDPAANPYFMLFTEISILEQLSRVMFEARLPDGFALSHFAVLNHLMRVRDGRTPLDLAKAFQVPKTTMTHTLAILTRHGLVRVAGNPKDGRSKCIWITELGKAFRTQAIANVAGDFATLMTAYPVTKIAPLIPGLQKLREIMDGMRTKKL